MDSTLFDRYLAGECTPAEVARVRAWIAADPTRRNVDAIAFAGRADVTDAAWTRVSQRLGARPLASRAPRASRERLLWRPRRRFPFPMPPRVAALWGIGALAMTLLVGIVSYQAWHVAPAGPVQRFATGVAEITTVQLRDGSHVTLAPQTTLLVPATFGQATRAVTLVGKAYFDVASAPRTPFVVDAGGVETHVLGTAFSVRRYRQDTATQVAVASGRVAVRGASRGGRMYRPTLVLSAGMIGTVTDSTTVAEEGHDMTPYTEWTKGAIVFTDTPIPQALDELQRWYGITFVLTDSALRRHHLSATLNYRERADMLNALKQLLNVDMTFHGDTATLRPRRPAALPRFRQHSADSLISHFNNEVGR
jgi:ferric-dicitrate binding protein FerR (iron transport regulator)